jgi:CPA1 family monovalent cation:H+ antiporter
MNESIAIFFSLFSLLLISVGVFFVSRRLRVPFTVSLVTAGLLLIPVSHIPQFSFITSFELTPELLFFVFLPTLIFESAYNMKLKRVLENIYSIATLSVASLLISAISIAVLLHFILPIFGFAIPFIVLLLFGTLISATDPVAVLALFKEYGAPKRLSLIFEGESLFNDATAFALFLIILDIIAEGWGASSFAEGVFVFSSMMAGGILFGLASGFLFSKIIEKAVDYEYVEITLTMIVAHLTFLFAELISHTVTIFGQPLHLSSIIATVVASMVVGNFAKHKMSPHVQEYMENFWGYFAFIANSLVFILIGLLFANLPINFLQFIIPIAIAILVVIIARALSVYPITRLLNTFSKEESIPTSWQHLLAWGSLRGALAIIMILLIPDDLSISGWSYDFSVKDFITALTIGSIYFTLFVKATTIGPLINKLELNKLHEIEQVEYEESKVLIYARVLVKLSEFKEKGYIDKEVYEKLTKKYTDLYTTSYHSCNKLVAGCDELLQRVLAIYAIGVEKSSLKNLYTYHEITERVFKKIEEELDTQFKDVEKGRLSLEECLDAAFARKGLLGLFDKITRSNRTTLRDKYMYFRAKRVIARKAIKELSKIANSELNILRNEKILVETIDHYRDLEKEALIKVLDLKKRHPEKIGAYNETFAEHGVFKAEERILDELLRKELITPKVHIMLHDELDRNTS